VVTAFPELARKLLICRAGPVTIITMDRIRQQAGEVLAQVADAGCKAGRPGGVTVVAVTKTVGVPEMQSALMAGVNILGESRIQEAEPKWRSLEGRATWHMVGHLQSNKVKKAVRMFNLIQTVDTLELARAIDQEAGKINKVQDVLIQVNASAEATKYGAAPAAVEPLARAMAALPQLHVCGLMTIGPLDDDPAHIRACFRSLRELRDRIRAAGLPNVSMEHLSMGMSNDYKLAIEEGATLVRIGRAIFGARCQRLSKTL
jgi:pyridoxal phosphate enzyme (YggS family)